MISNVARSILMWMKTLVQLLGLLVDMVVNFFCENAHAYIKAKSNGNYPVGINLKMEYFIQELMNMWCNCLQNDFKCCPVNPDVDENSGTIVSAKLETRGTCLF
jgi:hypothetical protein